MWSLVTFAVSAVVGVLLFVFASFREKFWAYPFAVVLLCYGMVGFLIFGTWPDAESERAEWLKAKSESELLKTDAVVDVAMVVEFKDDIDCVNNMVRRSRKYSGHWYLGAFQHTETAELETLNYDTVNVNIVIQ